MHDFGLRSMQPSDIKQVFAIETSGEWMPWTEGMFNDCLKVGYSCWVLTQGDRVLGFVILSLVAGEGHILNLGVLPKLRRQGLGSQLIQHVLSIASSQNFEKIFLEVRVSNQAAIALYEKFGFTKVGCRQNYYPARVGREDAVVMVKYL